MHATKPDGTVLSYDKQGAGEPAIVFVHSLGDRRHYREQIDHFARRHVVITPDLAGFGGSTSPAGREHSFLRWADDLAWLCRQLDVRGVVAVGHSMSGAIVLELAAAHPKLISALVLLDPVPIVPLPMFRERMAGLAEALRGPQYRDVVRAFAEQRQFRPDDNAAVRSRLVDDMCAVPQDAVAAVFAAIAAWDGERVAAKVSAPILQIVQGGTMPVDLVRLREVIPGLELGQTVGAGHWAHVFVPDQVNSMIDRFLSLHRIPALADTAGPVPA